MKFKLGKLKTSIRFKMQAFVFGLCFIIYSLSIGYISYKLKEISYQNAIDLADSYANTYANDVQGQLNKEMHYSRVMAQAFRNFRDLDTEERLNSFNDLTRNILMENPDYVSTWSIWEFWAWNDKWKSPYGRLRLTYYRENGIINYKEELIDTTVQNYSGSYYDARTHMREDVTDPYFFSYTNLVEDQILETSVFAPILEKGKFVGMAGIDLSLQRFQPIIEKIKPFEGKGYAVLLANNGTFVGHPNPKLIGMDLEEDPIVSDEIIRLREFIRNGKPVSFKGVNLDDKEVYVSYAPIQIGDSMTPCMLGIIVPIEKILFEANEAFRYAITAGIIGLILMSIVIYLISYKITLPLNKTTEVLKKLSRGDIHNSNKIEQLSNDELGQMNESLNILIDGLNNTTKFAQEIGQGKLESDYVPLGEKDTLGKSLIDMQRSLKEAKRQEEIRKKESEIENWATQGMATFGEVLRENTENMNDFAYSIISNLVKFVGANQGGLFVLSETEEGNKIYELLAFYAYNRRKYKEKHIEEGVGLVGRCVIEKKTIHMVDIPANYVYITSGLGKETPNSLLLVPLVLNDEIFGVVELASFGAFEKHQIDFIEQLGESIASTISNAKVNQRTQLLLEESRIQSEELASQEEEMRQNMEELQATQEEAARKAIEMEGLINALHSSAFVVEYDLDGFVMEASEQYIKLLDMPTETIIGAHHMEYLDLNRNQMREYSDFWNDLLIGKKRRKVNKIINMNGKIFQFVETYTPIKDSNGEISKILKIAFEISEFMN